MRMKRTLEGTPVFNSVKDTLKKYTSFWRFFSVPISHFCGYKLINFPILFFKIPINNLSHFFLTQSEAQKTNFTKFEHSHH